MPLHIIDHGSPDDPVARIYSLLAADRRNRHSRFEVRDAAGRLTFGVAAVRHRKRKTSTHRRPRARATGAVIIPFTPA